MAKPTFMPSHQSLVYVRHSAIPEMVRRYLECGDERNPGGLVEHKFVYLSKHMFPAYLSENFCDRMRPIPYDSPVFSAQQISNSELDELKRRGLV